jgi:hypothetical protein
VQYFSKYGATITPAMNYGVAELPRINPPTLGMGIDAVDFHQRFGPEPNPAIFENFLNKQNTIRLNTKDLKIPEPSSTWKQEPGYTPTQIPGEINKAILQGYLGVT